MATSHLSFFPDQELLFQERSQRLYEVKRLPASLRVEPVCHFLQLLDIAKEAAYQLMRHCGIKHTKDHHCGLRRAIKAVQPVAQFA